MIEQAAESKFRQQTTNHRSKASFRSGQKLIFRKKLSGENRAIVWVHRERHREVERIAEGTGLTMAQVTDVLLRFALANAIVVGDDGKDHELKEYLDSLLGIYTSNVHKDNPNRGEPNNVREQESATVQSTTNSEG